jgi:putative hydrolase of the HAD superfamily
MARRSSVKNVIFDVGGVLLDWNPGRILEGYYADPGERAAMKELIFHHPDWLALDRGELSETHVLERIGERARRAVPELVDLFAVIRDSLLPKHDTVALLAGLAQRGVPLYCLSNMPTGIYATLRERFDFWNHFDGIVISGEIKLVKPEAAIFEHLLRRFDLVADESVFIDDLPANVAAAKALGLHGVLFESAAQVEAELRELA